MKTIYLIRHAKSSWSDPSLIDFKRPLNRRGIKDAPRMAKHLHDEIKEIDFIISSPARRAIETAKYFANQFSVDKVELESSIYEADSVDLFRILQSINDSFSSIMLFGHNPGLSILSDYLLDDQTGHLPTCGIMGIEFYIEEWKMISKGLGSLKFKFYPKQIFE